MYSRAKELVAHFYGRLFGRCPELESLFADTAVQQQHAKLWAVLTLIATVNDDDERSAYRFKR